MKTRQLSKHIPLVVLAAGLAGILLRILLYTLGPDDLGLISHTHILHLGSLVIVIAAGIYIALACRNGETSTHYRRNFPANRQLMASVILAPACFLVSAVCSISDAFDRVGMVWVAAGFLMVPCMAYTLYCRMTGKRAYFLFHGIICLYFALDMICRYRFWSGNPQLADYTFHLFACVCLTLTAYYRTSFDVGMGNRRMLLFTSMMSVLLCMLCLVGPDSLFRGPDQLLHYAGGAIWAASTTCTLTLPRRKKPQSVPEEP